MHIATFVGNHSSDVRVSSDFVGYRASQTLTECIGFGEGNQVSTP